MPKEGISRKEYRTRKFGTWERSLELDSQVAAAGMAEGIPFEFDRIERTPNTMDAHRLIWLADTLDVQDAVVEALFQAYFTAGRDISDRKTLVDVVADAGLDRSKAQSVLERGGGQEAIQDANDLAQQVRVEGVPFFIFDGSIALSGVHPPEVILGAVRQTIGPQ